MGSLWFDQPVDLKLPDNGVWPSRRYLMQQRLGLLVSDVDNIIRSFWAWIKAYVESVSRAILQNTITNVRSSSAQPVCCAHAGRSWQGGMSGWAALAKSARLAATRWERGGDWCEGCQGSW
ncbi:unnamed protein product [Polarella glacialis]|uniref:Uncharacterized protein n=1 Tax=Polarella glacialis TaxID=89957 RepID=A0A813HQR9_POLGL|nr:unnamed protein product [Polarella glacialis]